LPGQGPRLGPRDAVEPGPTGARRFGRRGRHLGAPPRPRPRAAHGPRVGSRGRPVARARSGGPPRRRRGPPTLRRRGPPHGLRRPEPRPPERDAGPARPRAPPPDPPGAARGVLGRPAGARRGDGAATGPTRAASAPARL